MLSSTESITPPSDDKIEMTEVQIWAMRLWSCAFANHSFRNNVTSLYYADTELDCFFSPFPSLLFNVLFSTPATQAILPGLAWRIIEMLKYSEKNGMVPAFICNFQFPKCRERVIGLVLDTIFLGQVMVQVLMGQLCHPPSLFVTTCI